MTEYHVYPGHERPDVEVLVDGNWCPGEARMRTTHDDGSLEYQVQYRPPGERSSVIGTFATDRVRLDQTDRSAGREGQGRPASS